MLIGTVAILMGVFLLAVVALALARLRRRRGEHRASKTSASDAWSEAGRRAETHPWDRPPP